MKIKVCGMKDKDNIDQLVRLNPDYIGFIFHPQSKRFVDKIDQDLLTLIPDRIKKVGVFVDEPLNSIVEKYLRNKINILQLHGNEIPEYCFELKKLKIPIIKTFKINQCFDFNKTEEYGPCCDYFLFDTAGAKAGGNGTKFNWELLNQYEGARPFFLSGGIGPKDLLSILRISHPKFFGIDVNSGFEIGPGKKDIGKLGIFINELRQSQINTNF